MVNFCPLPGPTHCCWEHLGSIFLANFKYKYSMITVVTMLYIRSSKHIHLAQLKFCMLWLSPSYFLLPQPLTGASQVVLVIKNLPAKVGDLRDTGLIPRSGRSLGGRHGNPIFLPGESHGQRKLTGAHRVPQSGTWLKRLAARARTASENNLSPLSFCQFDGWSSLLKQNQPILLR